MPNLNLGDARLYYEDQGQGEPIIFIHGVWMSSRFFKNQLDYFSQHYRVIVPDLRAHGRSSHAESGHTIERYAEDLHALIQHLNLTNVTLVGWSMGAFVIWSYLQNIGAANIRATVVIDESASDFQWPGWNYGLVDLDGLKHIMQEVQKDRAAFVTGFIPLMFADQPKPAEFQWMFDEVTRIPESIASTIIFDQTVRDYRALLSSFNVPTLLCFGNTQTAPKLVPYAAGEYLEQNLPNAQLVSFDYSSHCPFLEEADRFNEVLDHFLHTV